MKKIDLREYAVADGGSFSVKLSLIAVLFNAVESPIDLLARGKIADKIEQCSQDDLLIEDAEYKAIVSGLNKTPSNELTRAAIPFVQRVLNAPTVEVAERQPQLMAVGD